MSKSAFTAFPSICSDLPQYCQKLVGFPPCKFWIHETKLFKYLHLPQGPEHGPCQALTAILACTKKGFGGDKIKKTEIYTGFDAVDLMDENIATGICYQQRGKK